MWGAFYTAIPTPGFSSIETVITGDPHSRIDLSPLAGHVEIPTLREAVGSQCDLLKPEYHVQLHPLIFQPLEIPIFFRPSPR
jgi:hypothetical protein